LIVIGFGLGKRVGRKTHEFHPDEFHVAPNRAGIETAKAAIEMP
jgi:hypothetical protein